MAATPGEIYIPLETRFAGRMGYPAAPMNPPPAEKRPTVVQFALTEGCSHATCTFCKMYRKDGERQDFNIKSFPEFKSHVDAVMDYLRRHPSELSQISRIFLGAGNALSADVELLMNASQYALKELSRAQHHNIPRRLAVYGNTNDILDKGLDGMRELYCGGTCGNCSINKLGERRGVDVIYWGAESGNSKVLHESGKGYTGEEAMLAGTFLNLAEAKPSVMIMPGLGGAANSEGHVRDSARLLNLVQPPWVTFIGLKIDPNTPYAHWMEHEEKGNRNRRLTAPEIAEQTAQMVERLDFPTSIGLHGDSVHRFGYNPVTIGVARINNRHDAHDVARKIRETAAGEFNTGTSLFNIPSLQRYIGKRTK